MSPGNAEVSLDEIYRLLLEVREDVTAMKAAGTAKAVADHEERIRGLERRVWTAAGIATGAGALVAQVLQGVLGG